MTPAEKKASELAEKYAAKQNHTIVSALISEADFRAGFLAALELAEVKGLEDCLNAVRVHIKFPGQYENEAVIEATENALTAWRSFRGEK